MYFAFNLGKRSLELQSRRRKSLGNVEHMTVQQISSVTVDERHHELKSSTPSQSESARARVDRRGNDFGFKKKFEKYFLRKILEKNLKT